jgi:hypothetical protein
MILRAGTRSRIDHATRRLTTEFGDAPPALIGAAVEAVATRLLEHARFDDYVPVLVHRYVREALRDGELTVAVAAAA